MKGTLGKAKGVSFMIWDVGGQDKVRPLWRSYTRNTDGIVFVVDSVDMERIEEARIELLQTVRTTATTAAESVPILVLANKQDLPGARDADDIEKLLNLNELSASHAWRVHSTCAVTGEGLDEGLENLYHMIAKRRKHGKHGKKSGGTASGSGKR